MSSYLKLSNELSNSGLNPDPEYRLFAEHVGSGPGVRNRLKESGLRDFRFDFAIHEYKIALEIQGSGYSHSHHKNQQRDWKKNNDALRLGWVVMYFPADMAKNRPDIVVEDVMEVIRVHSDN